jgi:hypothetical protein
MGDDLIRDRELIRNSDEPDVDRLVNAVYVALNSGRDRAVVQVVLDETGALRREVETLRARLHDAQMLAAGFDGYRDGLRARSKGATRAEALDRREANTWDVAAHRLRAALRGQS